jgi:hypothetical protein
MWSLVWGYAVGQDSKPAQEPQYVYEVWGTSTREPSKIRPWSEPLDSEGQAENRIKELKHDYGKGGLMESSPDKPTALVVRKKIRGGSYVDSDKRKQRDKKLAEGYANEVAHKLRKEMKERKPGSSLQEFSRRIADGYRNAAAATKHLTSLTGDITQKQFRDVNNLIDSYNRTRSDFRDKAGSDGAAALSAFPQLARVTPGDLKGKLVTGKWVVWVFKNRDGRWEKQEELSFSSDNEVEAERYLNESMKREGYTATSNLRKKVINLAGTTWIRPAPYEGVADEVYRFEDGGLLRKEYPDGTVSVWRWRQQGDKLHTRLIGYEHPGRGFDPYDDPIEDESTVLNEREMGGYWKELKRQE